MDLNSSEKEIEEGKLKRAMEEKDEAERERKKEHNKKVRRNILIVVLTIIIILLLFRSCTQQGGNDTVDNKPGFSTEIDENVGDKVEGKTKAEIEAELNEKVAEGMINISMNMSPVFEDGTSDGNLAIVNNESNNYPQVIEIYIKDTEELIYTSKLIPVGKTVATAKLDKDLEKGIYNCIAYFNAVDPDSGQPNGKAGAEIKVEILN